MARGDPKTAPESVGFPRIALIRCLHHRSNDHGSFEAITFVATLPRLFYELIRTGEWKLCFRCYTPTRTQE